MRKVTLYKLCSTLPYHIVQGKLKQKENVQPQIDRTTLGTSALFNSERRIDPLVESKSSAPLFPETPSS
jgi:hypothetical protein